MWGSSFFVQKNKKYEKILHKSVDSFMSLYKIISVLRNEPMH